MLRPSRVRSAYASAALALAACASSPAGVPAATAAPAAPPGWTLAWSDEFDGAAGALPDAAKWTAETGGQGWGNQEREYYTASENAALDGAGNLVITVRAEPQGTSRQCWYGACRYTSARLQSKGKFAQTYGRFEARMRLPRGRGLWPAFWMLGTDIDAVGWPRSGEIDVMEYVGQEPSVVLGTIHGPGYSGAQGLSGRTTLGAGTFADDFHVFAVEWTPGLIRWLVDDREYRRNTPADLPSGGAWVFDHPFFVLLNVAVGGGLPGDPDASTTFPQQMVVDYVRVYRQ